MFQKAKKYEPLAATSYPTQKKKKNKSLLRVDKKKPSHHPYLIISIVSPRARPNFISLTSHALPMLSSVTSPFMLISLSSSQFISQLFILLSTYNKPSSDSNSQICNYGVVHDILYSTFYIWDSFLISNDEDLRILVWNLCFGYTIFLFPW